MAELTNVAFAIFAKSFVRRERGLGTGSRWIPIVDVPHNPVRLTVQRRTQDRIGVAVLLQIREQFFDGAGRAVQRVCRLHVCGANGFQVAVTDVSRLDLCGLFTAPKTGYENTNGE